MPLPLSVSCFSKIQIGFTFLVPAHLGSPGKRVVKRVCVLEREHPVLGIKYSCRCCWFAAVGPVATRYKSTATEVAGECVQCHVVSIRR